MKAYNCILNVYDMKWRKDMDNTKKIYMACDIIREYVPYNTGHIVIDAIALLL